MEHLKLPGAAGQLWKAKRQIIHTLPVGPEGVKVEPYLGGGTILAARWKHRTSMDIDIFMPGRENLADLQLNNEQNIVARLQGTAEELKSSHIKIDFGESMLDLSTVRVRPEDGHKTAIVDGEKEVVLSNSQILRGKLERTTRLFVRDVFDVLVAEQKDRSALAAAVNMLPLDRIGMIQWTYNNANEHFADRYPTDITGVPGGTPERCKRPGRPRCRSYRNAMLPRTHNHGNRNRIGNRETNNASCAKTRGLRSRQRTIRPGCIRSKRLSRTTRSSIGESAGIRD